MLYQASLPSSVLIFMVILWYSVTFMTLFVVCAVYFAFYLTGLSSMMLI